MTKLKRKLQTYDQVITPILSDDAVAFTGNVVEDAELVSEKLSKSTVESSGYEKHPAVLIKSDKISVSQIPETHRESVIISLKAGTETTNSDDSLLVIAHRALVAGFCDFIDPANLIAELCPVVYEIYSENLETSLMVKDRVCEVIMRTPSYGVVDNVPATSSPVQDSGDGTGGESSKPLKNKFQNASLEELAAGGFKGIEGGEGQGVTDGDGKSTGGKIDPKTTDFLLVGDSIAAGMLGAAAELGYTVAPTCLNKKRESVWYWNCKNEHAVLSGTTTGQIYKMCKKSVDSPPTTGKQKKIMIVSAGTNDALSNAGFGGKGDRVLAFTVVKAIANIDRVIKLGLDKGYTVRVMLINPLYLKKMKNRNPEKIGLYNIFAKQVNAHIKGNSSVDTFHYGVGGNQVIMSDFIHPSRTGSKQLLAKALV